jgi:hypothetical protein
MNMTSQHIPYEQLADLASSSRPSEEAIQIRSHLAECAECASQFVRLGHRESLANLDIARVADSDPVANDTGFSPEDEVNPLNRLVAVLSFDSRQLSPAFGVRSGRSVARQLLFSIGENDLDLRVAPDDGAWIVSGQVLGNCESGQVVLRGANITERASMNELCEFYLPRVPPGSYSLLVQISNMEIEVPEFELRA